MTKRSRRILAGGMDQKRQNEAKVVSSHTTAERQKRRNEAKLVPIDTLRTGRSET
jgi:hypothetical protein